MFQLIVMYCDELTRGKLLNDKSSYMVHYLYDDKIKAYTCSEYRYCRCEIAVAGLMKKNDYRYNRSSRFELIPAVSRTATVCRHLHENQR